MKTHFQKAHFQISPEPLRLSPGVPVAAICGELVPNPDLIFEAVLGDDCEFSSRSTVMLCTPCLKKVFASMAEIRQAGTAELHYLSAVGTRKEAPEAA